MPTRPQPTSPPSAPRRPARLHPRLILRNRIPAAFIVLVLAIVILNHWLAAAALEAMHADPGLAPAAPVWLLMTALLGFAAAAASLHRHRLHHHQFPVWRPILALASADAVGVALHEMVHHRIPTWAAFVLGLPLLALALRRLKKLKHRWTTLVTVDRRPSEERPIEQLVIFVSPPTTVPERTAQAGRDTLQFRRAGEGPLLLSGRLGDDVKAMDALGFHNWQQMLRAIEPHQHRLKHVFLMSSPNTSGSAAVPRAAGSRAELAEGSYAYRQLARDLLALYLPQTRTRIHLSRPVDFEDSDDLVPVLRAIQTSASRRCPLKSFAIDVTGGQKTNSIVGAALTLLSESTVQYVQTAPRKSADATTGPTIGAFVYDLRLDLLADTA